MARILLIDDDEALIAVFSTALQEAGFETSVALDATSGIEKAKEGTPDLILLDQVMPDMSGNETIKKLKLDDKTKNIPVIILSNFSQEELVKEAINEGAVNYIFKYQVEPADVVNKVKEALREKS